MCADTRVRPRTFYLNEQHELARSEKEGGGRVPQYADIDWATKGSRISRSLRHVKQEIEKSSDPARENHFFVLATPQTEVTKVSENVKIAPRGVFAEKTDFAQKHSRVFRRLGVDLLNVTEDGSAVVHMKPKTLDQLAGASRSLGELGAREQARWVTIDAFGMIPPNLRIDSAWLGSLDPQKVTDAVVELQPLLTRGEIEVIIRAVAATLARRVGELLTGSGTDFSGRQWMRGRITPRSLKSIAQAFFSVQSLHAPLISTAQTSSSTRAGGTGRGGPSRGVDISSLPVIGVLDTGVPADHAVLGPYRRGSYVAPTSPSSSVDPHGCFVASRAVFGDPDYSEGLPQQPAVGTARFYDMNVRGSGLGMIEDKNIYPALQAIVSTAPDVRVFNMSFDNQPLPQMDSIKRFESLALVQDLDNFIFQNDVLVVISAGNSQPGVIPLTPYPRHFGDPNWELGPWARSFNALTCGSFVSQIGPGGLVNQVGWPSPFCRVGPGTCDSPKPDFSASGGNGTDQYQPAPGLGVWGLSTAGLWEDRAGTSFAAPLLARETAFSLQKLQQVCEKGAQPFAVTVKAFLVLTATPPVGDDPVQELVSRTLGMGQASAERLESPVYGSGVLIWQGVLDGEDDIARVQIPVPGSWLKEADEPILRLVIAWDPPANVGVRNLWATRRVSARLRIHPDERALRPTLVKSHASYPLLERIYNLRRPAPIGGDLWLVELSYEQIADYHPAIEFPPQQRVAFAAELLDRGKKKVSPQPALQSLPIAQTMTRLTVPPSVSRLPIVLRTPL